MAELDDTQEKNVRKDRLEIIKYYCCSDFMLYKDVCLQQYIYQSNRNLISDWCNFMTD